METQTQIPNSDPILQEMFRKDLEGPPQYLVDMRLVYNGHHKTPAQQRLKELWDKNPDRFLTRLERAEADYRQGTVPSGAREEPADKVSGQILDQLLSEEWKRVRGGT